MSDPLERHPHLSVVRRLAVGGMGEVLLTRFRGNARFSPGLVVVKRTIAEHPNRAHQDDLLREEGRVALRLRHANLVDTYALDEVEGHPLLVMEYLAGRSMAQVLGAAKRRQQPVPVPVALAVLHGAACGLHFAHTLREGDTPLGLVHRDVSPANVFGTFDGKVKVIDFGVAKADDSEIKTSTGVLKGKLGYMSPEHAKGAKLDPRADLWSLGVLLWEMLAADRLFGGQSPALTLFQITQGQLEPPSKRRSDLPPEVEELCMRLLTRDRDQRIPSGAELVREIERLPPELWREADVAGFLAERFPAEAELGRREVAEISRRTQLRQVPSGLVDGGGGSDESGEVATVVGGSPLLAAALAGAHAPPGRPPTTAPLPTPRPTPVPIPTPFQMPPTTPFQVPPPTKTDPFAPSAPSAPSAPVAVTSPFEPSLQTPLQHLGGPPAAPPPAQPTPPPPQLAQPRPTPPTQPAHLPPPPPTQPIQPTASYAAILPPPPPAGASYAAIPSPPPPASASYAAIPPPPTAVSRWSQRAEPPSALAVALSTFGALALVLGLAFTLFAQQQRETPPVFIAYPGPGGADVVVARLLDVPEGAGQPIQVPLESAQLALGPGAERVPIAPVPLARELKKAGVWDLALLPRTQKQRVALGLPAAITMLGLLSLAFALPALLLPDGARQLRLRAFGVIAALALGVFLLRSGGLGWPGLHALEEPNEAPRFALGSVPPELSAAELAEEDKAALTKALLSARAAILRGQAQEAVSALAPVIELAPELPALYSALGDAHRDLERPSLAEGHYLRYLELSPDAPDRQDIEAYLKPLHGAAR